MHTEILQHRIAGANQEPPAARSGDAVTQLIVGRLVELGWRFRGAPPKGWDACRKSFATAVGQKDAIVYLAYAADSMRLTADYQSEGGNALSTLWKRIDKTSDSAAIQNAVDAFSGAVDAGVAETYAARLLRRWGAA